VGSEEEQASTLGMDDGASPVEPAASASPAPRDGGAIAVLLARWRWLLFGVLGGLLFVALFAHAYSEIPNYFYEYRDDGIITLSHARNLVEFGSIGVDPSGNRLEGFSAPAQFWLYAGAWWIAEPHYRAWSDIQTWGSTFLLGFLCVQLFAPRYAMGLLLATIPTLLLSRAYPFLGWHGSGMENAVTHVLFLASFVALVRMAERGRIDWRLAIPIFIATLSRLESVVHVAPWLLLFAWLWMRWRRGLHGFAFGLGVALLWAAYQAWRVLYFGDWKPNTASAQNIEVFERLARIAHFDTKLISDSAKLGARIVWKNLGLLPLALAPLMVFTRRSPGWTIAALLTASTLVTAFLNPFVFGPTRLDGVRTTTQLALISALFPALLIANARDRRRLSWMALPLAGITAWVVFASRVEPAVLCCEIPGIGPLSETFLEISRREQLPRPSVSTPDLGKLSWPKHFNVVDLGMLGTPPMALLKRPAQIADYYFDYAAPDFIESHGIWSCRYHYLFDDPRFAAMYEPIEVGRSRWLERNCQHRPRALAGTWRRKGLERTSETPERRLIDDLRRRPSAQRVARELAACGKEGSPSACQYVTRSVYRLMPEIVLAGLYDEILAAFASGRSAAYDLAFLSGRQDGRWYEGVVRFVRENPSSATRDAGAASPR
jgi:hypothetical protein